MCPKTGQPMRFLAEIFGGQPVVSCSVDPGEGAVYETQFEEMTFWDDGVLYVCAHPEAETLCAHPQDT